MDDPQVARPVRWIRRAIWTIAVAIAGVACVWISYQLRSEVVLVNVGLAPLEIAELSRLEDGAERRVLIQHVVIAPGAPLKTSLPRSHSSQLELRLDIHDLQGHSVAEGSAGMGGSNNWGCGMVITFRHAPDATEIRFNQSLTPLRQWFEQNRSWIPAAKLLQ